MVPVTAIILFGILLLILNDISASNFLILFEWINKIPFFNPLIFFSVTTIFAPLEIADDIKSFPFILFPLIAKKYYLFLFQYY